MTDIETDIEQLRKDVSALWAEFSKLAAQGKVTEHARGAKLKEHTEKLEHLEGVTTAINHLDDRADESDKRHTSAEESIRDLTASVRRLTNGITARDLLATRLEKHMDEMTEFATRLEKQMLEMSAHLKMGAA